MHSETCILYWINILLKQKRTSIMDFKDTNPGKILHLKTSGRYMWGQRCRGSSYLCYITDLHFVL